MEKNESLVPHGPYCYSQSGKICPYWKRIENKPDQLNGYCSLLEVGDWMKDSFTELYDYVKACSINENLPYEDDLPGRVSA